MVYRVYKKTETFFRNRGIVGKRTILYAWEFNHIV